MTGAKIRREVTRDGKTVRYVHVFCEACRYWHGFGFSVLESFERAERHLMNVHGLDAREAGNARRQWEHKQQTTKHEIRRQSNE